MTVLLTAADNAGGAGVKQITYSAGGAQTIPAVNASGNSASFVVNVEGTTTISFFATDNAGNAESPRLLVVMLDRTPPTLVAPDVVRDATGPDGALVTAYPTVVTDTLDPNPQVSCIPGAPHLFPIVPQGASIPVQCVASDAAGNLTRKSFSVHVGGAVEQLSKLIALINGFNLGKGTQMRFEHHLEGTIERLRRGETRATCSDLAALVEQAQRESGRKLAVTEAAQIVEAISRVRSVLGCMPRL